MHISYQLPQPAHSRQNNFDALRLILAVLVLLSHGRGIFGLPFESTMFHLAELAVNGFFIISGFLISWSIDRSFEWRAYAVKRLARIYPLYFVVITVQLALLWYFNPELTQIGEAVKYYLVNLAALNFLQPYFGSMVNEAINGSLWTIKIELMFYAVIPVWIWCLRRFGLMWLGLTFLCAFAWRFGLEENYIRWARQIPGSMAFFIAGSAAYFFGPSVTAKFKTETPAKAGVNCLYYLIPAFAGITALYIFYDNYYAYRLLYILGLTVAIYIAAFYLPRIHLKYDISYGIYLWHVPIFLTLRHIGFYEAQPIMAFILGSLLISVVALASAILIEVPFIKWGSRTAKQIGAK